MGGAEILHGERAADAVAGHELVHPREAIEVELVELPGRGLANRPEHVLGVAPEEGLVRHVGETNDGHAPRPHAAGEITVRRAS